MTESTFNFDFPENCFVERCLDDNFSQSGSNDTHTHLLPTYDVGLLSSASAGPYRHIKRRGRPIANNAARERSRVKTLRTAFLDLQRTLPAVPPDTKLSKLDVLVLATTYIAHLMNALQDGKDVSQIFAANGCMHPVKKWPMRTRLYAGILSSTCPESTKPEVCYPRHENEALPWFQDNRDLR